MRNKLQDWHNLVVNVRLQVGSDSILWPLNKNGTFTLKPSYGLLVSNGIKVIHEIWRTKLPLEIKVFLWFLKKRVILNEDNLTRRNQNDSKLCCFCTNFQAIHHLFFECYRATFLWHALHIVFVVPPLSVERQLHVCQGCLFNRQIERS